MIKIEQYMNDGANWQAQAVLTYIRALTFRVREATHNLITDPKIEVGRYENCREQGYVFRLKVGCETLMNYAVYEHRNSDQLIVLKSDRDSINTPSVDQMWNGRKSKYEYDKAFGYGQIIECGKYILNDMENLVRDFVEKHPSYTKETTKMREFKFTSSYPEWHLTDLETGTLLHVMDNPFNWIYTDDGKSIDYYEIKEVCYNQLLKENQTLSREEMEEASTLMADTLYDSYCELDDD